MDIAQFVLHAHMPYVLDTSMEYWLHEVVMDCYLPLLEILEHSKSAKVVVHLSPTIIAQCSRKDFVNKYKSYCDARLAIAELIPYSNLRNDEITRVSNYSNVSTMLNRFSRLQCLGKIRILSGMATHPFLPLLNQEEISLHAKLGMQTSSYFFGDIAGLWTPECGLTTEISAILSDSNFLYTYADPSCIPPSINKTNKVMCRNLKLFIRDVEATSLIWDNDTGYPGHSSYQDFHSDFSIESPEAAQYLYNKNIFRAGFSLRSIGNKDSVIKPLYQPLKAQDQLVIDAYNFIENLSGNEILAFDAELFGHWWREGIHFLKQIFDIAPPNFFQFPEEDSDFCQDIDIQPSTWGTMSDSSSWINSQTAPFLENMRLPKKSSVYEMRAKMLSQASDWLFLISHNSFKEEASYMISNLRQEFPRVDDIFTKLLAEEYI
ncbi:MAG: hypothetical protein ACRC9L_05720 [Brevinema sp.]